MPGDRHRVGLEPHSMPGDRHRVGLEPYSMPGDRHRVGLAIDCIDYLTGIGNGIMCTHNNRNCLEQSSL